jgi:hypothetical protein
MGVIDLDDESLLRFYNHIRDQVELDRDLPYKLMTNDAVKQRASALRQEITRRRLRCAPIDWPEESDSSVILYVRSQAAGGDPDLEDGR